MNVWRRRAFKGAKGGFFMELEMYRRYSQMARGIEKAAGDIRQPFCKAVKSWWKVALVKKKQVAN